MDPPKVRSSTGDQMGLDLLRGCRMDHIDWVPLWLGMFRNRRCSDDVGLRPPV